MQIYADFLIDTLFLQGMLNIINTKTHLYDLD